MPTGEARQRKVAEHASQAVLARRSDIETKIGDLDDQIAHDLRIRPLPNEEYELHTAKVFEHRVSPAASDGAGV